MNDDSDRISHMTLSTREGHRIEIPSTPSAPLLGRPIQEPCHADLLAEFDRLRTAAAEAARADERAQCAALATSIERDRCAAEFLGWLRRNASGLAAAQHDRDATAS